MFHFSQWGILFKDIFIERIPENSTFFFKCKIRFFDLLLLILDKPTSKAGETENSKLI